MRFLYINPTKTGTPIKAMMTPTGIQAVPSMIRDMASATSKAMAPIGIESAYVVRISHRYIDRMRLGTTSPTKLIGPHCDDDEIPHARYVDAARLREFRIDGDQIEWCGIAP